MGTVSANGLYTAPGSANFNTAVVVRVRAESTQYPGAYAVCEIRVNPVGQSGVTLSPDSLLLNPGGTATITASVSPGSATLQWSQSVANYLTMTVAPDTKPVQVKAPNMELTGKQVTVTATVAGTNPPITATANVTVNAQTATLTVSPSLVTMVGGTNRAFTVTATGQSASDVVWSLSQPIGQLTPQPAVGATVTYIAPSPVTANQTVLLTAKSLINNQVQSVATINLVTATFLNVVPATAVLYANQAVDFVVESTTNPNWSISPSGVGTFTTSGKTAHYAAPSSITNYQTITINATAGTVNGTATVVLQPALAAYPPGGMSVSTAESSTDWFTFSAFDPNETIYPNGVPDYSPEDISFIDFVLDNSSSIYGPSPVNACAIRYHRTSRQFLLTNDAGDEVAAQGALGSTAVLENSSCRVLLTGSTMTDIGITVSVRVMLKFKETMAGTRYFHIRAGDVSGFVTGWGVTEFVVQRIEPIPARVERVTPSSGEGFSQDAAGNLWWYNAVGGWVGYSGSAFTGGAMSATPR